MVRFPLTNVRHHRDSRLDGAAGSRSRTTDDPRAGAPRTADPTLVISRRAFIAGVAGAASGLARQGARQSGQARAVVLANGIRLSDVWPPVYEFGAEPATPPYLTNPPRVLPVDLGRQLFVDDFLIEETTLVRAFHRPQIHSASPVVHPDRPWELADSNATGLGRPSNPTAMVFGDAVLWDWQDRLFKMWYMAGYVGGTAYATSEDGIRWSKPNLDVVPGTNLVRKAGRDSATVWLVHDGPPDRRYKMCCSQAGTRTRQEKFTSADGVHWTPRGLTGVTGDRTTCFYNPFNKKWVFSLRAGGDVGGAPRHRRYAEFGDFESAEWPDDQPAYWVSADARDPRREDYKAKAQLYCLDCVAYESVLLGLFTIWRGESAAEHKHNDVCLGFSRDGFHWSRLERQPFLQPQRDLASWMRTNVQPACGCCLVVGSSLRFYFSARAGRPGTSEPGICSTGLALLRRDGFASMTVPEGARADERRVAALTTRPIQFGGRFIFVNAAPGDGELRVELLDEERRVVPGFGRDDCVPVRIDTTAERVQWRTGRDIAKFAGRPFRLRFHLSGGHLYSFWIAREEHGASLGYLGMGAPGATADRDLTGAGAATGRI